ncbi:hypothetical protein V2J09_007033, partial [Rumex salicifolius]
HKFFEIHRWSTGEEIHVPELEHVKGTSVRSYENSQTKLRNLQKFSDLESVCFGYVLRVMVLHRRLNYGFNGYEVPPIPRAARSIRKRGPLRSKIGDNQMCAFDLLATVAGKILLEGEIPSSALSNEICENEKILGAVKQELGDDDDNLSNAKNLTHKSPEIGPTVDEHESKVQNQTDKEIVNPLGGSSLISSAVVADETDLYGNNILDDRNSRSINLLREVKGVSSSNINLFVPKHEDTQSQLVNINKGPFGVGPDNCSSSEDPKLLDQEPPALVNSDTSVNLYLSRNHYSCGSPFLSRDNVKVVSRDDDENPSRCTQRSTGMNTSRPRALTRGRRIRKMLASKYWRRPSKVKYQDHPDAVGELHSVNQFHKNGFKRQRSRRIYPLKKRKTFYKSQSTSDGVTGYKNIYMCSKKDTNTSAAYDEFEHEANNMLSVLASQSTSFQSRESHVKVRVKSFRVPELFIELPETATVGSLKRTVMEAITTLLGGELHVGVLLKGRKIKDDSKTLVQTGISHDNKVDSLGFTLEPNYSRVYSSMSTEDTSFNKMPQPISRLAPADNITHQSIHALANNQSKDFADLIKSDHDPNLIPAEISMENDEPKALITFSEENAEALEVVPPLKMSKRQEMAQRRIRRPFSVTEVEALVGAVEKLGTGRWRDVKLLSFDNAEHRTYVDLKDKWKTLVHTARISPQQRRGEPVPQELLDRVLVAHANWCQQQPKQQPEACLLLQGRESD